MLIPASPEQIETPTAIALGNFDGIHRGHTTVLQPILNRNEDLVENHIYPSVVSFSPHPREFFTGKQIKLLTPIAEKAQQLAKIGIEQFILLPFDRELASFTPQQFVEQVIVEQLQAVEISVGSDFRFGHQRKGTAVDLKSIASGLGIKVHLNSLYKCQERDRAAPAYPDRELVRVSSSLIRQALEAGEVERANFMLGRPYTLIGEVVRGQELGRTIGFPTANLKLPPDKFLPRFGVYSVQVALDRDRIPGVMNIGCRPTVAGEDPTIEVHLLNWSGNLYGQTLSVSLKKFLRSEQKFPSLEALKSQITKDCQAALRT